MQTLPLELKLSKLRPQRTSQKLLEQLQRVKSRFPNDINLDNFEDRVASGEFQVFTIGEDSVMVGKAYHNGNVRIVAAAGNLEDLLDFEFYFCEWYKARGFTRITLGGRRGWSKYLLELGWRHSDFEGELVKVL